MHGNDYLIPGARGIQRVFADNGAVSAEVAAAVASFKAAFEAFKTKHGDRVGTLEDNLQATAANLLEVEQRLAGGEHARLTGRGSAGNDRAAVLAQHLIKNDGFQGVIGQKTSGNTRIEVDSAMLLGSVEASTIRHDDGFFDTRELQPGVVEGVKRRTWLRNRFPTLPTQGGTVEYHRELVFTNNAAPQGSGSPFIHEGVAKAESAITYEAKEEKIPTIAHFIKASKQIMSDVNGLRMTLSNRLLYGLELAIESQIITGQGTSANMSGLTKSGNFTAFTPSSGDSALDSINRALGAIETADGAPDLVIMHPLDFRAAQRIKATGGSEEYLFGSPSGANGANVWNTPIHTTPAMTQGKFIALDVQQAAVIYERMNAVVDAGWVDSDFTANLLTLLAEIRLTIAVQRPTMVRYGDLVL